MTVSRSESPIQQNDPFAFLYPYQFIRLTTLRKSGEEVPTTVWFAQDDAGRIYVITQNSAGKIKRIRRNGEVKLTPSDVRGTILDGQQPVTGYARQVQPEEHVHAEATLKQKYGDEYVAFKARMTTQSQSGDTYIEILSEQKAQ